MFPKSIITIIACSLLTLTLGCPTHPEGEEGEEGESWEEESIENSVVGAWYIAGTLASGEYVEVGWTLCADNRMYGFTEIDGWSFLDKGTWTAYDDGTIDIDWSSMDTYFGDVYGPDDATFDYDDLEDELCCFFGAPMWRLEGTVSNSDCDPGW